MVYKIKPEQVIHSRKGSKTITRTHPDHLKYIYAVRKMAKKNNDQIVRITYEPDLSLIIEIEKKEVKSDNV